MCCSKFIFQYRLNPILKCTSIAKDILNAYRPQSPLPHTPRTQPKRKSEAAVPESWSAVTRACTNEYFAYPTEALANALMQGARVARRDEGAAALFDLQRSQASLQPQTARTPPQTQHALAGSKALETRCASPHRNTTESSAAASLIHHKARAPAPSQPSPLPLHIRILGRLDQHHTLRHPPTK